MASFVPVGSCKTLTPDKMASYAEGLHLSCTVSHLHLVKFYKTAEPLLQVTNIKRHNSHFLDTQSHEAQGYTKKAPKYLKKILRCICSTASDMEQSKWLLRSMLPVLNLVCHLTSVLTWGAKKGTDPETAKRL